MKISELLKIQPEATIVWDTADMTYVAGYRYKFFPEVINEDNQYGPPLKQNTRITISVYKDHNFDGRRIWRLCVLRFDGAPFMVTQNAGREGDDHKVRFIFNEDVYQEAVKYIHSLLPEPICTQIPDVVDVELDIPTLTAFYDNRLDGYFDRY